MSAGDNRGWPTATPEPQMPYFGACCAKPPVEGKEYTLILDDDELPPHIHSYKSIRQHLEAALEMLEDGEEMVMRIKRKDMTKEEIEKLPEI